MGKKNKGKVDNWNKSTFEKVVTSLNGKLSDRDARVELEETYYIDMFTPIYLIDIYEVIGTFETDHDDSNVYLVSSIRAEKDGTDLRQYLATKNHNFPEEINFDGPYYKPPKKLKMTFETDERQVKGIMLAEVGFKLAQDHREKIESILKVNFNFWYDCHNPTAIFNGKTY